MSTGHAYNNSLPFYEQEAVGVMAGIGDPINWINIITPEFDAAFYKMIYGIDRAKMETYDVDFAARINGATGFIMSNEQGDFDLTIDTSNKMKFIISPGLAMTKDGYRCTKLSASEFDLTEGMAELGGTQTIYIYGLAIQNHESILSKLLQARIGVTSSTIAAQLAKQTETDPNCDYFGIIVSETMDTSIASQVHAVSEGADVYILPFWKLTVVNGTGVTGYTDLRDAGQTVTLRCPLYAYQAVHLNGEVSDRTICPTQPAGTNNLTIANTQFVQNEITRQINYATTTITLGGNAVTLHRKANYVWCNTKFSATPAAIGSIFNLNIPPGFRPKSTAYGTFCIFDTSSASAKTEVFEIDQYGDFRDLSYLKVGYSAGALQNYTTYSCILSFGYEIEI